MKALSLTQPWASLVSLGVKHIETRGWQTPYRGWIAIHAAKTFPGWAKELCARPPFHGPLCTGYLSGPAWERHAAYAQKSIAETLPLGAVIAIANLHRVGRIHRRRDGGVYVEGMDLPITGDELKFGDYAAGRWAWALTNVHPLATPVPAKGRLGLWEWDAPAGVLPEGVRL